jgi:phage terminase large subunit-like protein
MLRLPDVPGQPPLKDAAGEWQRDLVRAIFGSVDQTGLRCLREFFVMVPKKNSKTTAGASIMVAALLMNERPRAEFLLIAPTLEIADLAFRQAAGMIEVDPILAQKFAIQHHLKTITYRKTKAFLKVKSVRPARRHRLQAERRVDRRIARHLAGIGRRSRARPASGRLTAEPGSLHGHDYHSERTSAGWCIQSRR